jgi:YidC/Oxa1 family membrane protein insertase
MNIFNTLLFNPIFNALIAVYNLIPYKDIGISIIIITILLKLALHPFTKKSLEAQKALQALQPEVDRIKEQYKDDKEKQAQELMKMYSAQKVNPLSSCLPMLVQIPFFIAMYRVFTKGLTETNFDILYPFISSPEGINTMFLGFVNLTEPNVVLAVLAGLGQFVQTRMLMSKSLPKAVKGEPEAQDEGQMAMFNKQISFIMPIVTIIIGMTFPSGLTLYWIALTLFTIAQQYWVFKIKKDDAQKGDVIEGEVVK